MPFDWVIADNAEEPFCAVVDASTGEVIERESRFWSTENETWVENRANFLNQNISRL